MQTETLKCILNEANEDESNISKRKQLHKLRYNQDGDLR